jgi:hypothetical protein
VSPGRAVAVAAALVVAGCGGDEPAPASRPAAEGPLGPSARLQTATCREWRAAPRAQRSLTVDRLEEIAAGPRKEGGTLPDAVAYETLQARCGPRFARGFLLYDIYNRAAGFQSLAEEAEH